jgi:hypothetical protein
MAKAVMSVDEAIPEHLHWPERDRIGRIVQDLSDDFATAPRIRSPLHLDKRRNPILVEE